MDVAARVRQLQTGISSNFVSDEVPGASADRFRGKSIAITIRCGRTVDRDRPGPFPTKAVETIRWKQAYSASLRGNRTSTISRGEPVQLSTAGDAGLGPQPHTGTQEARRPSAGLRPFSEIHESRENLYLV